MKFKILLQIVLVAFLGQFLFSCSSAEYYRFAAVKPETYQKSVAKVAPATAAEETNAALAQEAVTPLSDRKVEETKAEPVLEASTKAPEPVLFETRKAAVEKVAVKAGKPMLVVDETTALEMAKDRLSNMSKTEKKAFKKEVKHALRDAKASADIVEIILAVLLPPLAVYLHEGEIGSRFWISVLLTILFYLPGIIYALLVVTDTI